MPHHGLCQMSIFLICENGYDGRYVGAYQEAVNRFLGEVTGAAHHLRDAAAVMRDSADTHMRRLMLWFMLLLTNVSLMGVVASLLVSPRLLKLVRMLEHGQTFQIT